MTQLRIGKCITLNEQNGAPKFFAQSLADDAARDAINRLIEYVRVLEERVAALEVEVNSIPRLSN